ncbi:hypothetical protein FIV34_17735 [Luteibacter pinisoli]|uniref:Uncharacterized protein n=1 Tax=Luteibacter pinisoli TaxID=2589080 RepID=A0A4Y5Z640_9GAMM|nr:hypothetical protein [Luteibacter pinisoli]QDE40922.1 hypothetical protein FIV34_17735 [Luteibacter pinisoli]
MTTDEQTPSVHDLLNDATQWLQYARSVMTLVADLVHEADEVDCKQLSLTLEAIAAMTARGTRQLGEARAQMSWEAAMKDAHARIP